MPTLELIIGEVFQASFVGADSTSGDPLAQFTVLLLSLRLSLTSPIPLIVILVEHVLKILDCGSTPLTGLLERQTTQYAVSALARLIKQSLFISADLHRTVDDSNFADGIVERLTEEIAYQRSRPVDDANSHAAKKAGKAGKAGKGISPVQKGWLDGLCGLLGADEEVKERWPGLSENLGVA